MWKEICSLYKHLEMNSRNHLSLLVPMYFKSDFGKSLELVKKVLDKYKYYNIELDSDSVKIIVCHFIQMGNLDCAKNLLLKLIQQGCLVQVDAMCSDLIIYFIYKAVNC